MKRRTFLKAIGAVLAAPAAIARAIVCKPKQKLPVQQVVKTLPFEYELRKKISQLKDKGLVPREIYVNKSGYEYLKNLDFPGKVYFVHYGEKFIGRFDCIPIIVSDVPYPVENEKPHGSVRPENPKSIFRGGYGQWDL